jgi:hypothetical protein
VTFREQPLGYTAVFLLPSLKLKEPSRDGQPNEIRLHVFLMDHFAGYTAQAGNIFGYWRNGPGPDSYGEHREFSVAFADRSKVTLLKEFLATMARDLNEDCVYLCVGDEASLIYP